MIIFAYITILVFSYFNFLLNQKRNFTLFMIIEDEQKRFQLQYSLRSPFNIRNRIKGFLTRDEYSKCLDVLDSYSYKLKILFVLFISSESIFFILSQIN